VPVFQVRVEAPDELERAVRRVRDRREQHQREDQQHRNHFETGVVGCLSLQKFLVLCW
jgi:hypothetical protein